MSGPHIVSIDIDKSIYIASIDKPTIMDGIRRWRWRWQHDGLEL